MIEKYLRSIGKRFFVDYYEILKESPNKPNEYFENLIKEDYTFNSFQTKISCSRTLFKEGLDKEALRIITKSNNVDEATRQKAFEYLNK